MPDKIPESVLVVIHTAALEVLLIERADKPGFWQSVTGSLDALDEPLILTAARELFEETGICADTDAASVLASDLFADQQSGKKSGHDSGQNRIRLRDWQVSNVYEIYPIWRHRYAAGVTQNTEHVFSVEVPREIAITLSAREHLQYMWLPYLEAADKCFSASNAEAILQLPKQGARPGF